MKVLTRYNIFETYKNNVIDQDMTFDQMLDYFAYPDHIKDYVQIRVNGQKVNKKYWKHARPIKHTEIAITVVPRGGDSSNAFRTLITIGAIAAGAAVGGAVLPTAGLEGFALFKASFGQGVITAGFSLVGSLLANSLFPPPKPELDKERTSLPVITGQSNQLDPNGIVPRNYGTNKIFPRLIAQPYTVYVNNDQYFYGLYDFGSGNQQVVESELKIGDTLLSDYKNVDYNVFQNKDDMRLFLNRVEQQVVNASFEEVNQTASRTTSINTESISVQLVWPTGLAGFYGSRRKRRDVLQTFQIEVRETGTGTWRSLSEFDVDYDPGLVGANQVQNIIYAGPVSSYVASFKSYVSPVEIISTRTYENFIGDTTETTYRFPWNGPYVVFSEASNVRQGQISRLPEVGEFVNLPGGKARVEQIIFTDNNNRRVCRVSRNIVADYNVVQKNDSYIATVRPSVSSNRVRTSSITNESVINITSRTTSPFRKEIKINPKEGKKQWDIKVTYLNIQGTLSSGRLPAVLLDQFTWQVLNEYKTDNPIATDKVHTYLELKIKATDEINGQVDTLNAIVNSYLPVYDSVNELWKEELSNNPAWVFASILTNDSNQRAISLDKLDTTSLLAWANYCDTNTITYKGDTVPFECNFVHDFNTTVKQLLEQVCSIGRASLNISNGTYGVIIDEQKTTPTQMFNQRNIKDMNVTRSYAPTPNGLRVKFVDPASNWQDNTIIAYDDGYDATNATLIEDIESFATTEPGQAWRLGRYLLAQQKLRRDFITINVDFESLACARGDLVYFTHDVIKNGGTPGRVKAINGNNITIDELVVDQGGTQVISIRSRSTNTVIDYVIQSFVDDNTVEIINDGNVQVDDLCVYGVQDSVLQTYLVKSILFGDEFDAEIELVDYNEDIYLADQGAIPEYDVRIIPNPFSKLDIPTEVQNLDYAYSIDVHQSEKRYIYTVNLTWDAPLVGKAKNYEVYLSVDDAQRLVGFSESSTFNYEINGFQLGLEHTFKVLAVNALGDKLPIGFAATISFTPTDDETLPADVTQFNANILTDTIELDWTLVDDLDIDRYLIRYSPATSGAQWTTSAPIVASGATQDTATVPLRTGTYLIRARDYAGNISANPARVVTTVPELSKIEFISEVTAPAWNGTADSTQFLGDNLILRSTDDLATFVNDIGEFFFQEVFDLGDIFTARFVADISSSGFSQSGLMSNWITLASVDPIAGDFDEDDFDASAYIRTRNEPDTMVSWTPLASVDYLSFGSELTATPWIKFKAGDFTGRIFQLKIRLEAGEETVTPIVYSVRIEANWNERIIDGKDQASGTPLVFDGAFVETPAIQITSQENTANGDYFLFTSRDETGFTVQFYDTNDLAVNDRKFDWIAKGVGKKYTEEDINF